MAVYGGYEGLTEGASRAAVFDLVPDDVRGRALGVAQSVSGIGVLLASVTAGVRYEAVSPAAPFVLGAAFAFLAWSVAP